MTSNEEIIQKIDDTHKQLVTIVTALNHNSTAVKDSTRDIAEFLRAIAKEQSNLRQDFFNLGNDFKRSLYNNKNWFKLVTIAFVILGGLVGIKILTGGL